MKMVILQMFLFIEIKFKLVFVQSDREGEGQREGRNDGTEKGRNKVKWNLSVTLYNFTSSFIVQLYNYIFSFD